MVGVGELCSHIWWEWKNSAVKDGRVGELCSHPGLIGGVTLVTEGGDSRQSQRVGGGGTLQLQRVHWWGELQSQRVGVLANHR